MQYTPDVNEYVHGRARRASDRVRVVEIGRTVPDRPINMFIIGYPTPPRNEGGRRLDGGADQLQRARQRAVVPRGVPDHGPRARVRRRPRTLDILSSTTVLIVPTINGDGRAANTRGNSTGQDLNRDYSLIRQPETFAFVEMMRDYRPEAAFDGHEFGNSQAGDLPVLPPRHLNVAQSIHDESKSMIEDWLSTARPTAGGTARTVARAAARSGSARRRSCATRWA